MCYSLLSDNEHHRNSNIVNPQQTLQKQPMTHETIHGKIIPHEDKVFYNQNSNSVHGA